LKPRGQTMKLVIKRKGQKSRKIASQIRNAVNTKKGRKKGVNQIL